MKQTECPNTQQNSLPNNTLVKGRLKGTQRWNLSKLIDMLYTPTEIAAEIKVTRRQIYRVYIPLGCPHIKDAKGHQWINGLAFREWYLKNYRKIEIAQNQAFCKTCMGGVEIVNPDRYQVKGATYLICDCPNCGRRISKIYSGEVHHD